MKKTLRKPENWQDFETLCKKLWGEIWGIPNKIKKNGRLGQTQFGVDIFGIPKGENDYWGIQCKGKDDYTNAQLTKKEIDQELEKAKHFKPTLKVFIITTTANKDVNIEEYVREKDKENKNAGSFEILIFCWEDIVDLIEENRDTYYWYLNDCNVKDKYDFEVFLNDFSKDLIIRPKFLKKITKYRIKEISNDNFYYDFPRSILTQQYIEIPSIFGSNKINRTWCKFEIIMQNTGNAVIEDWKLRLKLDNNVKKLDDDFDVDPILHSNIYNDLLEKRTAFAYPEEKMIIYRPYRNEPLIQKDNRYFNAFLIPNFNVDTINIEWELLARDFDKNGTLKIKVDPIYVEEINWVDVSNAIELKADSEEILELIENKK